MLIRHSFEIVVNRLARMEAGSAEAGQALVAKYRGEQMVREAVARLDAEGDEGARDGVERGIDRVV